MTTLTEQHRLAQLRLGAQLVAFLHGAFRLLDPRDLDGTFRDWFNVVAPLVQRGRKDSVQMAAAYLTAIRSQAVGLDARFAPTLADDFDIDALTTSLFVTGPASIKAAIGRRAQADELDRVVARALDVADGRSAGAAMRYALAGGRETVLATVRADHRARGWARVASGKACNFCSELDGRVFSEDTAAFQAHDGCSCSAEPVFA